MDFGYFLPILISLSSHQSTWPYLLGTSLPTSAQSLKILQEVTFINRGDWLRTGLGQSQLPKSALGLLFQPLRKMSSVFFEVGGLLGAISSSLGRSLPEDEANFSRFLKIQSDP